MKKILIAASLASVMLTTGCATIVNDDYVQIPVTTVPSEASIEVNGSSYQSPAIVPVPRGQGDFVMKISKDGYQPVSIFLNQSLDGWVWGNVIFGGIIGLVVDFATGDAYDISPDVVNQSLTGAEITKTDSKGINVVLIDINTLPYNLALELRGKKPINI